MSSNNESGHIKNIQNFDTLIITCNGYSSHYNPSNDLLKIDKLQNRCETSKKKLQAVKSTEAPYKDAIGQRKQIFALYKPLTTKVLNALRASSASPNMIANAESIYRKIQGKRSNSSTLKVKEGVEVKKVNSVSQQSFDFQIDNFEKFLEILPLIKEYRPNEVELQLPALLKLKQDMQESNTRVKTLYVPYKNALQDRNTDLYSATTGMIPVAQMVKAYVKSVFGAQSMQYKQISSLRFNIIKV